MLMFLTVSVIAVMSTLDPRRTAVPTIAHVIVFCALPSFSSSPPEVTYINPPYITPRAETIVPSCKTARIIPLNRADREFAFFPKGLSIRTAFTGVTGNSIDTNAPKIIYEIEVPMILFFILVGVLSIAKLLKFT